MEVLIKLKLYYFGKFPTILTASKLILFGSVKNVEKLKVKYVGM